MANNLVGWDPDNESKWENEQEAIAKRNLWISIPSLLCGFAIWVMWSIITVQMLNTGYGGFDQSQLFTLTAIAGLSGATLRIPSTFFISLAGGKNSIFITTLLLILPAAGVGVALSNPYTPFWHFKYSHYSQELEAVILHPQCQIFHFSFRTKYRVTASV